ncbi:atrial natriuretic peptide receptor 1-like isoform X2 [Anthonomus grandis grandis]|uniref:atrial natriuretic peptide receptor 1-like isoform X2 n=1 Tax=Anthonomus grandis grandis TaxID=2921223 RepID=UPI002165745F|nr:atrial natriuretic peptide receptor 1-like isoform X2 [Anthonomus grandis grandis]
MLLRVTMVVLLLPFSSAGSNDSFDNSILKYKTWPIGDCTGLIPEGSKICKEIINTKENCKICNDSGCTIHVAVLFPANTAYILNLNRTEKIIVEAAKDVQRFVPDIKFDIRALDDGCKSETGLGQIIDAIDWCPHVIFGHTCDYALAGVGRIAKLLGNSGVPLLSPGGFTLDFTSNQKLVMDDEFYHLVNVGSAGYASFGEFLHLIADRYDFKRFALFYEKQQQIEMAGEDACYLLEKTLLQEFEGTNLDYSASDIQLLNITYESFLREKVGVDYAIVLTCANHSNIREIAINAAKIGMMDRGEYLFLNFALYNNAPEPDRPWYDENDIENNEMAKKGFGSFLTFYPYREAEFEKVKNQSVRGSFYLDDLYESMFIYAQTLSNMTENNAEKTAALRGCDIVQYIKGKTFTGKNNEEIIVNCNLQRVEEYALVAQDEEGVSKVIGIYSAQNRTINEWNPNFSFPPDTPKCGFDLSKCPTYNKVNVLLISLISSIFFGLIVFLAVIYRHYKLKAEIYAQSWKVNYDNIVFFSTDRRNSIHSIGSNKEIDEMSLAGDNQLFAQIGFYNSIRVAIKKLPELKLSLTHKQLYELKVMKDLSNDNLVKFYGACIDVPHNCLLVEYCPRGSLQDILEDQQYKLDWAFRMSLIMDIVRGMHYLHASHIKSHGALKSSNCLVDSRFVLKISNFGLHFLKGNDKYVNSEDSYEYWKKFLWTAPELLRMPNPPPEGTQKGDVYSFAIIMEEIIMREGVFYIKDSKLEPKDIVELVRKGPAANNGSPLRPTVARENDQDDMGEIENIIDKCWSEDPHERPDFVNMKAKLRQLSKRDNEMNLFDNLLRRMEHYANNLETLVLDRTKDYLEEKRKCEEVLYQLLPKSVAQQLIMGQSVTAEAFDCVTIYFSDIVGFTELSAESTPLQVVDLLNDLYGLFDERLEHYQVYKVETIGDAYMVVSGLPERNGERHAYEISRMALDLRESVRQFKIRHKPNHPLRLRIGIHSGQVVAGVVGRKMPRYCLFGDTVNTASRMENNGAPFKIHISEATKKILERVGQFEIELRGEVELKGKGKMTTYWLIGEKEGNKFKGSDDLIVSQGYPLRPGTPRLQKAFQEQIFDGRYIEGNGFIPESSTRHILLVENARSVSQSKKTHEESEVPLLSITQPSLNVHN